MLHPHFPEIDIRRLGGRIVKRSESCSTQILVRMPNGFGISCVTSPLNYCDRDKSWELALVRFTNRGWQYDLTDPGLIGESGVLGWQRPSDIAAMARRVRDLLPVG